MLLLGAVVIVRCPDCRVVFQMLAERSFECRGRARWPVVGGCACPTCERALGWFASFLKPFDTRAVLPQPAAHACGMARDVRVPGTVTVQRCTTTNWEMHAECALQRRRLRGGACRKAGVDCYARSVHDWTGG